MGDLGDAMSDVVREVLGNRAGSFKGAYAGPYEVFMGFLHAVDWASEPWLQAVLGAELGLLAVVVATRKWPKLQFAIFVCLCALVYSAEWINGYCREHWQEFATQNYFDPHGFFAGMVFAGPLLLVMFFQMLNSVYEAGSLVIESKRAEIRAKRRGGADANTKKEQ